MSNYSTFLMSLLLIKINFLQKKKSRQEDNFIVTLNVWTKLNVSGC